MDTLSLSDRAWKGFPKDSPQEGTGVDKQARKSTPSKGHAGGFFARAKRIPGQLHAKKWIFSRESTRIDAEIPVTISGIDEDGRLFSEETHTVDVSKRGAKIASSSLLAIGTYLRIESPGMQNPIVARVVRHGAQSGDTFEICVTLPEADESDSVWNIESPPNDWKTGPEQPSAARRLERIYARDWATKFESLSKPLAPSAQAVSVVELPPESAPSLAPPSAASSEFEMQPGKILEFVMGQAATRPQTGAPTLAQAEERTLSPSEEMQKAAASDVETRLARLSLAMESLEGRVGVLVENFQGRIESSLQAFQGKEAKQAEELEKIAQELGGRWSRQFQEQAEAAAATLREELKNSSQAVEASKQQLASLAEAKLASLSQATQDEYAQRLAQALREQTQEMHAAADGEVNSIKQAAAESISHLQTKLQEQAESAVATLREEVRNSGQAIEQSKQQLASLAEAKVASLSQATQDEYARRLAQALREQTQEMRAAADGEVKSIRQAAAEAVAQLQGRLQEQAESAVATLREELKNSGEAIEQSKQQLTSLAEAKVASLSQATRDEHAQRLAQSLREQTQEMRAAADGEVKSIRQAAAEAVAQLQTQLQEQAESAVATLREEVKNSSQAVEASKQQLASLAEAKLTSLSQATRDEYAQRLEQALREQMQEMRAAADGEVTSIKQAASEAIAQLQGKLQEQAESAVATLREEVRNSGQVIEQSKQQLTSLAEAKVASLSQATQDEYAQRLAQSLREQAQEMRAAADGEVKSIRQAAAEAVAQLQGKLQEQAESAVAILREELKNSGQAIEASKQQLASLAEAKLASLSQATRDEYAQRLAQSLREQTQEMRAAADGEVTSIRQAASEAIAQLQGKLQEQAESAVAILREEVKNSSQAVEASKQQLASLAEAKLTSLSQATRDEYAQRLAQSLREQTQEMRAAADGEVKSIRQAAAEAVAQLQTQLQEQAESAVATLREEVRNSSQAVELSKQQLASLAEAKLASLSQVTRDEYTQRLAQALRDQTQEMHAAADTEVNSIKLAAAEAISLLQAAEQLRENFLARADATEERLKGVSSAVESLQGRVGALADYVQRKDANKAEELEGIAQELRARWSQQFQEQAGAAVEALHTRMTALAEDFQGKQAKKAEDLDRISQELEGRWSQRLQEEAKEAVEALQGRVGTLAEDLQGQQAKKAEDLARITQELGAQWSRQFQEQAEAAVQRLREEAENSRQALEETKKQLASLVESRLASLGQANPDGSGQQLAQALQEQAQQIQAAADAELKSIKQAAEEAIAEVRIAEQKREANFLARASAAEERLTAVSLAVDTLSIDAQSKGAMQTEDLRNIAEDLAGQMGQQFQKQTELAVEKVRAEVRNSGRAMEEMARQLSGLAETKRASLNQVATNAAAGFEAQQRRLKIQFETARKDLEDLVARRSAKLSAGSIHCATPSTRKGLIVKLALAAGLFLLMVASLLAVSLSTHTVMQLRSEAPSEFVDTNPTWNAKRQAREEEVAQAYWRTAAQTLQAKYPFGAELPADPPDDFQVDSSYAPPGGPKALEETRAHYWEKIRSSWGQRAFWLESQELDNSWGARFHHTWERIKGK